MPIVYSVTTSQAAIAAFTAADFVFLWRYRSMAAYTFVLSVGNRIAEAALLFIRRFGGNNMVNPNYLARHAAALLKLAKSTADRAVAAALVAKAADLKARIDESEYPEVTPLASPDIEPPHAN
jgi:hypothetical protein